MKKAQQRLFFLRQLRKFRLKKDIMVRFYRAVIESVLTFSITVWFDSASQQDKLHLQRIVNTASKIIGRELPSIESLYHVRALRKIRNSVRDPSHPANHLFESLPSGKRMRTLKGRTNRFLKSFFP